MIPSITSNIKEEEKESPKGNSFEKGIGNLQELRIEIANYDFHIKLSNQTSKLCPCQND